MIGGVWGGVCRSGRGLCLWCLGVCVCVCFGGGWGVGSSVTVVRCILFMCCLLLLSPYRVLCNLPHVCVILGARVSRLSLLFHTF